MAATLMDRLELRARAALERAVRRAPDPYGSRIRDGVQRMALRAGRGHLVPVAEHRLFLVQQLAALHRSTGGPLTGQYLEFGVFAGSSLSAAVEAFDDVGVRNARFVGFDSFAGLPPGSEDDGWETGAFAISRSVTEWHLRRRGVLDRVDLVEGWFEDTCTDAVAADLGLGNVLVAMVDCDTYTSSATALAFVEPLLATDAIVVFDDWHSGDPANAAQHGQQRAFRELLDRAPSLQAEPLGDVGFRGRAFRLSRAPLAHAAPVR